jgi:diguanylate cyclase (GGDEF)-like protein
MVIKPLKRVVSHLRRFIENQEEVLKSDIRLQKYYAKDEIGDLVDVVNDLLDSFRILHIFKQNIENYEDSGTIYERLGWVLKELVGFDEFIIYEVSNSQNSMRIVYSTPPDVAYNADKLFDASRCRARRTGEIVSSITFPGICKYFAYSGEKCHFCIPMMSGSNCVGVVELHLPMFNEGCSCDRRTIETKLNIAKIYIDEATPVIEAKRYAESLKEQAFKDTLTGLYNRRFLEAIIDNLAAQVLRRETVLGILMCDLDFFKSVNDKYGHDAGDLVLKQTAQVIKDSVRKSDIVVRFGGEEFLVLLVDVEKNKAVDVAEKIRKNIEIYDFKIPQGIVKRTISIGVSEFPTDADAIWEAIKYADVALYKAKEFGRNRVVRFVPEFWQKEEY